MRDFVRVLGYVWFWIKGMENNIRKGYNSFRIIRFRVLFMNLYKILELFEVWFFYI